MDSEQSEEELARKKKLAERKKELRDLERQRRSELSKKLGFSLPSVSNENRRIRKYGGGGWISVPIALPPDKSDSGSQPPTFNHGKEVLLPGSSSMASSTPASSATTSAAPTALASAIDFDSGQHNVPSTWSTNDSTVGNISSELRHSAGTPQFQGTTYEARNLTTRGFPPPNAFSWLPPVANTTNCFGQAASRFPQPTSIAGYYSGQLAPPAGFQNWTSPPATTAVVEMQQNVPLDIPEMGSNNELVAASSATSNSLHPAIPEVAIGVPEERQSASVSVPDMRETQEPEGTTPELESFQKVVDELLAGVNADEEVTLDPEDIVYSDKYPGMIYQPVLQDESQFRETTELVKDIAFLSVKHHLTDVATLAILQLQRKEAARTGSRDPSTIPGSIKTMKSHFGAGMITGVYHVKCRNCGTYNQGKHSNGLKSIKCMDCSEIPKQTQDFFLTLSLRRIFEMALPDVHHLIRPKDMDVVAVKELKAKVDFDDANDIILVANTDGVQLTSSTYPSGWPLLCSIYGLAEHHRSTLRNMFLASIGISYMGELELGPMLWQFKEQLLEIQRNPIEWIDAKTQQRRRTRLFLLCMCCDAPARAKASFMQQFNGTYGCGRCYHEGKYNLDSGRIRKDWPLRTMESHEQDVREFEQELRHCRKLKKPPHKRGVKGRTPLADLSYFDVTKGFPIDVMHCVYAGIIKTMLVGIFGKPEQKERLPGWIPGVPVLEKLNQYLATLKPPRWVSRAPRPWRDHKDFKFHEWAALAFFYLPPVLRYLLKMDYSEMFYGFVQHFSLLCKAGTSDEDLRRVHVAFKVFRIRMLKLLPGLGQKFNFHCLDHLVEVYKLYGPLFRTSLRPYETFNRTLVNFASENQYAASMIYQGYLKHFLVRDLLFKDKASKEGDFIVQCDDQTCITFRGPEPQVENEGWRNYREIIVYHCGRKYDFVAYKSSDSKTTDTSAFIRKVDSGYLGCRIRSIWANDTGFHIWVSETDVEPLWNYMPFLQMGNLSGSRVVGLRKAFWPLEAAFYCEYQAYCYFVEVFNHVDCNSE